MPGRKDREIVLRGAREHNLRGFELRLPRERLTVITGVSGSGKSSLAFDTLFREGQRRFLETLPAYARSFVGGLQRPAVTSLEGLGPAVAVGQRLQLSNPRSTVGTLTEVWDLLRLLFARLGDAPDGVRPTRGLFSFNAASGACPQCQGLGVEDRLDPALLVADPQRSLRQGALRVSTPNGYLMYSQVTLAVLDQVLQAHGGSVDIPWQELSDEARQVVLYGSERLTVPYGKHPLESRMKWTGITARPRQEGFYRGLVPVMEGILRGKRNDSILRFVRSAPCRACGGARLRPEALAVRWQGQGIVELAARTADQLRGYLSGLDLPGAAGAVFAPIRADLLARCAGMAELGLGYLAFDRPAPSLSPGEAQRLRLLGLALGELRGLLVVLDEPSAGLHPREVERLLGVLHRLCAQGQTVVVVEHDPALARGADWLVDLGPGPGRQGGQLLFSGPPGALLAEDGGPGTSATREWLTRAPAPPPPRADRGRLRLEHLARHNVLDAEVELRLNALNLIAGPSGAGKTALLEATVERLRASPEPFPRVVLVDAAPIGRTPRSNAATYTGAFDLIRDVFAATPRARELGLGKGSFSFNTPGGARGKQPGRAAAGRCEACQGAGVLEVGMRYLGSVELPCEVCRGRRFQPAVLEVCHLGRSIADVLESSVAEAAALFAEHPRLRRILGALVELGLGYLSLGQPATTLSGGEAQRIKLATELARTGRGPALVALDEPSTGLHPADVAVMLAAWERLLSAGHTLLAVDNDLQAVRAADRVLELGPGSGPEGGRVVFQGSPAELAGRPDSPTGLALAGEGERVRAGALASPAPGAGPPPPMELVGVRTHNLRGLDASFPARGLSVVTGPSGGGKSSLVFDTLLAEAQSRFADLVAPWARRLLPRRGGAELEAARNLQATVAVPARGGRRNPRSTLGTAAELDPLLRLLYARAGARPCPGCGAWVEGGACACGQELPPLWAGSFSPNSEAGACPGCRGLGFVQRCDPDALVAFPGRPLDGGALDGTRFGAYLGEADGQHMACLRAAAEALGLDLRPPFRELGPEARALAMHGAGERVFEVLWRYRSGKRTGEHRFRSAWRGLCALVEQEHERTHADARGEALEGLLVERTCPACQGERLQPEARRVVLAGRRLPELERASLDELAGWLDGLQGAPRQAGLSPRAEAISAELRLELARRLRSLRDAGLGYLTPAREMASLSGGEAQRTRLATALGGGLVGVTYVLDEPTRGLHPRDTARLAEVLRGLADAGNAVVVVEHDAELVARADQVLEVGPGAGPDGGRLLAQGPPGDLAPSSYTARLLARRGRAPVRAARAFRPGVSLRGVACHNLALEELTLPVGALVAVTGVSGSGKSSLVADVLAPSLRARLAGRAPVGCRELELHAPLAEVLDAEQDGPAAAGASTLASLAGVSEPLRKRFAATPEARAAGLTARHFSSAASGGRCEACEGRGVVTVAMDLLPDVTVGCEVCQGRRFRDEVLACRLDGRDLATLLEASVAEVGAWFEGAASIGRPLAALAGLGLGYLRLGQEGRALSAGELQRLRLALLLARTGAAPTAVLLDEPSRGLGFEDVERLVAGLQRLAEAGHLVVVVEHDLELISAADWVIDLGPEGGAGGGRVVVQGTPQAVAAAEGSHTGRALAGRWRAVGLVPAGGRG
ncbi:MAG TPA: hypothetical protein PK668_02625 [Myxococcota bacterium]|nr:hypothetical protein [Myxococcota bacterium]HRY94535.1 hypothetical protein [Myxococcota bacterium]HSA20034.1 hypothetical protein [Myxococcota bacterium]